MATQYVHGEVGFGACVVVAPGHPTAVPAGFPLLGAAEVWTGVCQIGENSDKNARDQLLPSSQYGVKA